MAEKYFITMLADVASFSSPGHAFVNFGKESDAQMSSITDGTFGMYPDHWSKGIIGEVPGQIKDDFLRNSTYKKIVEVSEVEYDQCLAILKK